jgi:type I restriction enzyme M protein
VIHRPDVRLVPFGDLCDVRDGMSPNMATAPGDFVLVVPAEDRKTADHWDYEGKAICIPLVSSSGHGKADIKRIHYQEGKFALATTMCAAFVKDDTVVSPRYLHLFLNSARDDLLVPLMCGATNVTMTSSQLTSVLVPVPERWLQDEVVESHLIRNKATEMLAAAKCLCQLSTDTTVISLTERVIRDLNDVLDASANKATVEAFIPARGVGTADVGDELTGSEA